MVAQTLKVGYLVSTLIFFALFLVAVVFQLKAGRFHPAIYWTVIALTSTAGTTLSDLMNRAGGIGDTGGALVLSTGPAIVFVLWWRSGQTLDVEKVATFRGELLYWVAILFSNSLGTSSGDFLADVVGLGFRDSALVLSGIMLANVFRSKVFRRACPPVGHPEICQAHLAHGRKPTMAPTAGSARSRLDGLSISVAEAIRAG